MVTDRGGGKENQGSLEIGEARPPNTTLCGGLKARKQRPGRSGNTGGGVKNESRGLNRVKVHFIRRSDSFGGRNKRVSPPLKKESSGGKNSREMAGVKKEPWKMRPGCWCLGG